MLGTFPPLVAVSLWVDFVDKDVITHALAKGGGHVPVRNMHWDFWLHLPAHDTDLMPLGSREDQQSVGPTRNMFDH